MADIVGTLQKQNNIKVILSPITFNLTDNTYVKAVYKDEWKVYLCSPFGKVELEKAVVQIMASKNMICPDVISKLYEDNKESRKVS